MISALGLTAVRAVAPTAASALSHHMKGAPASTQSMTPAIASSGNAFAPNPYASCIETAENCVASAEVCLTKMMELLAAGEKRLFECAFATRQMLPV